jgi:cyclic pyranopterin phosphate synthase
MPERKKQLSHVTRRRGAAHSRMVDVGEKSATARSATAQARVRFPKGLLAPILRQGGPKGPILEVARVAGIQAAKRTAELIPMCHPLGLDLVEVDIVPAGRDVLLVTCTARLFGKTGVEMEALVGASLAALTLYDMTKALDAGIVLEAVRLVEKRGGRRGVWRARGLSAKRGSRIQTGS